MCSNSVEELKHMNRPLVLFYFLPFYGSYRQTFYEVTLEERVC